MSLRDRLEQLGPSDDPFSRESRDELRNRLEQQFGPVEPAVPAGPARPLDRCLPIRREQRGARQLWLLERPDARSIWHGRDPVVKPPPVSAPELGYLADVLAERALDPERVLFLDTETTGLAGGTGTYVFLVGLGRFRGARFEIVQLFLPDLDHERAMLEQLADSLDGVEAIVTYNGKSFDLPLLETRFTLNRLGQPFEGLPHIDLVHASRRFWSDKLENCRLETLERALFEFYRTDDVPGHEIPRRYYRYLEQGDGSELVAVFDHNARDILSLAALYGLLVGLLSCPTEQLDAEALTVRGLIARRMGLRAEAILAFEQSLDSRLDGPLSATARKELSLLLKREERWEEAAAVWYEMLTQDSRSLFPYVELAKFYEHRAKDYERAKALSEQALRKARGKRDRQRLVHRLRRLERRLSR